MDGVITRACGSAATCLATLSASMTVLTGVFQFIAALAAAISGCITVWLLWKKVKAERGKA